MTLAFVSDGRSCLSRSYGLQGGDYENQHMMMKCALGQVYGHWNRFCKFLEGKSLWFNFIISIPPTLKGTFH